MNKQESIALFTRCEEARKRIFDEVVAAGKPHNEADVAAWEAARSIWNAWAEARLAEREALETSNEEANEAWAEAATVDFSGVHFYPRELMDHAENFVTDDGSGANPEMVFYESETCHFDGYIFPGAAQFDDAWFFGAASFAGAQFYGIAHFDAACFSRKAEFKEEEPCANPIAVGTLGWNETDFSNAHFHADAWFTNAHFADDTRFTRTHFHEDAVFNEAQFTGTEAQFDKAQFTGSAQFMDARFQAGARFSDIKFNDQADFRSAQFADAWFLTTFFVDDADFEEVQFEGEASFNESVFAADTSFLLATFAKDAAFHSARFGDSTQFNNASFAGEARFRDAEFLEDACFWDARFLDIAEFDSTRFAALAGFSGTHFQQPASFENACFEHCAAFAGITCSRSFSLEGAEFVFAPDFTLARFVEAPWLENMRVRPRIIEPHRDEPVPMKPPRSVISYEDPEEEPTPPLIDRWRAFLKSAGNRWRTFPRRAAKGIWYRLRYPNRHAASCFRALTRLALQANDTTHAVEFSARAIRAARFVTDWPLPWPVWRADGWAGAGRFWFGLSYQVLGGFGMSVARPVFWWLAAMLLASVFYLGENVEIARQRQLLHDSGTSTFAAYARTTTAAWAKPHPCIASPQLGDAEPTANDLLPRTNAAAEALQIAFLNAFVVFVPGSKAEARSHACLYGIELHGGRIPAVTVPNAVSVVSVLQKAISALCIFLFSLALRNMLKVKA